MSENCSEMLDSEESYCFQPEKRGNSVLTVLDRNSNSNDQKPFLPLGFVSISPDVRPIRLGRCVCALVKNCRY